MEYGPRPTPSRSKKQKIGWIATQMPTDSTNETSLLLSAQTDGCRRGRRRRRCRHMYLCGVCDCVCATAGSISVGWLVYTSYTEINDDRTTYHPYHTFIRLFASYDGLILENSIVISLFRLVHFVPYAQFQVSTRAPHHTYVCVTVYMQSI